jgi:putative oxidoreductase
MEVPMEFLSRFREPIYALVRIVVGFLFLCHGVQKLNMLIAGGELPMPAPLFWTTALIESLGGLLVMIGLAAAPAAFLCSGTMAVAYFMAHQPEALLPLHNKGELAAIYSFVFLLIASRGSGIWSVDAARGAGSGS